MGTPSTPEPPPPGYALSGKIMLGGLVILFAVVVFMVCLHIYARWYLLRVPRRHRHRRRRRSRSRGIHIVFYDEPNNPNATTTVTAPARGLDSSVLSSLPVFLYSSKTHPDSLECAVCLSEFEDNEKGRLLPKCNHSFHIDCIGMWFLSHSTCPLCRSPVERQIPAPVLENLSDVVVSVDEPAETRPDSSSGLCFACQHDEDQMDVSSSSSSSSSSSDLSSRTKAMDMVGVSAEIPRRNESEDELGLRSPGTRLMSFKRILSFNRLTAAVSPSSGIRTSCGSTAAELDIERGMDESTHQTRPQTPR
uniref:RING-type E3 ubiquitin transferase n=1 Tax=Davidia involucrata TaxID=16924 RepID=A0A5B7BFX7_DAVIN